MKGIPETVTTNDTKIMVKLNNMNMPLPKKECERIFGREPGTEGEAHRWALRLRKSREKISFDNIKTGNDRPDKKEKRARRIEKKRLEEDGIVKVELSNVKMLEGKDLPTMKQCIEAAIKNDSALVEREITDKDELNLKLNLKGKRTKCDASGQTEALPKILAIMEELGIDQSSKVTFADQS